MFCACYVAALQRQLILMGSPFIPKSTSWAQANLPPAGSDEFGCLRRRKEGECNVNDVASQELVGQEAFVRPVLAVRAQPVLSAVRNKRKEAVLVPTGLQLKQDQAVQSCCWQLSQCPGYGLTALGVKGRGLMAKGGEERLGRVELGEMDQDQALGLCPLFFTSTTS